MTSRQFSVEAQPYSIFQCDYSLTPHVYSSDGQASSGYKGKTKKLNGE